jgi:polyisoprenoid-binding protein YceI
MLIKVLAAEGNLSSASNVDTATVVRLYNGHSAAVVITRKDSGGTTIGSFSAVNGEVVFVEKDATDTLTAASNGSSIKVAKVAYGN